MATQEAINIQCIGYIDRIEKRIQELTGLDLTPMPRNHKDNDILRMQQLQNIASWLERIETSSNDNVLDSARQLVTSGKWSKDKMENILLGSDDGNPDS